MFYSRWKYFNGVQGIYALWAGRHTGGVSSFFTPIISRGSRPFTPNLLSISECSDALPGLRLRPVLLGPRPGACPRAEGKAGETEKGTRRGEEQSSEREGWNKSETDARTRVIQHFETEQGQNIPSYSLYRPAALWPMYSYSVFPGRRSSYRRCMAKFLSPGGKKS